MRKRTIPLIIVCLLILSQVKAQSISPDTLAEVCPGVNIQFTVTLPNTTAATVQPTVTAIGTPAFPTVVSGISSPQPSGTATTFNFTGRFMDHNNNQIFRVAYTNSSGAPSTHDFIYRRVKSLYPGNNVSNIQPNHVSLPAELCQEIPFTISFTNIKYVNTAPNPALEYGTVTNYEYLLPANWKLGTTTSDGVTWLQDDNSVSITSDRLTGGHVFIRAINTACATGLIAGVQGYGQYKAIPIIRNPPPLSMSGTTPLCYPSTYNYSVSGVPTNGTLTWEPHSYYSLNPTGATTADITPTQAANGSATIAAKVTVTGCSLEFPVSKVVSFGPPYIGFDINAYPGPEPCCYEVGAINTFQAVQSSGHGSWSSFYWGYRFQGQDVVDPSFTSTTFAFIPWDAGTYQIFVRPVNACGVSSLESTKTVEVYNACGGGCGARYMVTVLPNPAKDFIQLRVTENTKDIKRRDKRSDIVIELYEGTVFNKVKVWKFSNRQLKYGLDVRGLKKGIYYLRYIDGDFTQTKKVVLQ